MKFFKLCVATACITISTLSLSAMNIDYQAENSFEAVKHEIIALDLIEKNLNQECLKNDLERALKDVHQIVGKLGDFSYAELLKLTKLLNPVLDSLIRDSLKCHLASQIDKIRALVAELKKL